MAIQGVVKRRSAEAATLFITALRTVGQAGFAGMTEHMFAEAADVAVDENAARSGNFGGKSTGRGRGCGEKLC
jgi:hypothetical protein